MATATQTAPQATRTLTTRRGRSIETPLTDAEALAVCRGLAGSFPQDLARNAAGRRGLSPDQVTWTHILACEELDRRRREAAPPEAEAPALILVGIADLFRKARGENRPTRGLKSPEVHLPLADDLGEVRLFSYIATHTRFPGWIGVAPVTSAWGPRAPMHGRIDPEGAYHPLAGNPEVEATLAAFSDDPAGFAARCGHLSGRCCFCRQQLTDARSVAVGYGKTCSRNWSLPYGTERQTLKTVAQEVSCEV